MGVPDLGFVSVTFVLRGSHRQSSHGTTTRQLEEIIPVPPVLECPPSQFSLPVRTPAAAGCPAGAGEARPGEDDGQIVQPGAFGRRHLSARKQTRTTTLFLLSINFSADASAESQALCRCQPASQPATMWLAYRVAASGILPVASLLPSNGGQICAKPWLLRGTVAPCACGRVMSEQRGFRRVPPNCPPCASGRPSSSEAMMRSGTLHDASGPLEGQELVVTVAVGGARVI